MLRNKAIVFLSRVIIAFFMFSFFFAGNFLFGQEESSISGELKIIAQYKEKISERIFATGNVEIHYKNVKLFADRVELDTETKDVFAVGNVVIQMPDEVISVEEIRFNLESTEGKLQNGFGLIQPSVFYEAETIERKDANVYSFYKARITSCTQSVPRWRFSCSRANFKRDDYIEMWNSVFSIKKIPVFYFPYMRYPLDKEKSTGFLMPQLGYSGVKGIFYAQSFFWDLKRNMDATLNFNYYSVKGLAGGLEYRYLFSQGTGGRLNLYYFIFKEDPEQEDLPNAYIFRFNHNQPLPFNFALVADVDYQSSFDFLREFDNNFRRAIATNRSSQVYLSRAWSYFSLNMRVSRFETYYTQIDDSIIRRNLPTIGFSASKIKLFGPLYFSFSSSFDRWEYGYTSSYQAGTQRRSQNLSFNPVLTLPFTAIPWLTLNSSFTNKFNYYFQSYAPRTSKVIDEPLLSHIYVLRTELLGPVFYRIFFGAQNEAKVKHIIEPSFTYHYESPVAYPDRIITTWYFFRYHYISYGLTNRIIIKQNEMPREVFTFGLGQTFYLAPEESPLKIYKDPSGEIPKFSDISGYMRFYPATKYSLDFSAGFNPYYMSFASLRLGANLGSPEDSLFLRVNWYLSLNPYYESAWYNRHQIGCFGGVKIPGTSLEAQADIDFNIQERKMLYSAFALIYHYQCLDFRADLKIFYFREKPEAQFRISFGLGNIGKTTDFLGGMGF